LRIERIHMIHPIVFFHGSSKLMLFDEVLIISLYRGRCDEANLLMIAHDLLVDVKRRHIILLERTFANKAI
jgi:hypothetical protein